MSMSTSVPGGTSKLGGTMTCSGMTSGLLTSSLVGSTGIPNIDLS